MVRTGCDALQPCAWVAAHCLLLLRSTSGSPVHPAAWPGCPQACVASTALPACIGGGASPAKQHSTRLLQEPPHWQSGPLMCSTLGAEP